MCVGATPVSAAVYYIPLHLHCLTSLNYEHILSLVLRSLFIQRVFSLLSLRLRNHIIISLHWYSHFFANLSIYKVPSFLLPSLLYFLLYPCNGLGSSPVNAVLYHILLN